jgi:phosphoribosylglycinamide formyltransferase-1
MKRVAVLISGRGSNLGALIAGAREPHYPVEIALVLSDRRDAFGLVRAAEAAIPAQVVERERYDDRTRFERAIDSALIAYRIELIALAGFMRVLSEDFVARWRDRMINIHPSLLPSYRGLDTHRRALADGARIHGCTVHFVRTDVDHGPIIAQAAVPVLADDTPETLAARVLDAEHLVYPKALALVASGQAWVEGERVLSSLSEVPQPPLISPPP